MAMGLSFRAGSDIPSGSLNTHVSKRNSEHYELPKTDSNTEAPKIEGLLLQTWSQGHREWAGAQDPAAWHLPYIWWSHPYGGQEHVLLPS